VVSISRAKAPAANQCLIATRRPLRLAACYRSKGKIGESGALVTYVKEPVGIDFTDGALFGNDAGEDELPDVLNSYFVDQNAFRPFLNRKNTFQVARSRKGMGKSALLSKLAYDLRQEENAPIVISATGANLLAIARPSVGASYLELQNFWSRVICARINFELGKTIGFAFSENDQALVESSEIAGFRERNIVGSLIQRVRSSKIPIEVKLTDYGNHEELLKRAAERFSDRKVWILVDDIDSTYIDSPDQQALTSTFFSACRALAREVNGLYIRASVRTDVWSALRRNEDLDKCEQYVSDIAWSAPDLKTILSKKIYSYLQRNEMPILAGELDYREDADQVLALAFTDRMKWGTSLVPPFRPIFILSAGRPRWMCQLCRFAGLEADKHNRDRIAKADINAVMERYSRFRLNDVYKEHSHQYSGLEKLIETFSNSPARYTTADLLTQLSQSYVNLIGSGNIQPLDGFPYKYPLQLAHFLYKVGFIVGRREHENDSGNADFTRYEQRPELLVDGRNADDGLLWEIHPSYRDALNIGREKKAAKGAEDRKPRRSRRGGVNNARKRAATVRPPQ